MYHKRTARFVYHLMASLNILSVHVIITKAYIRKVWRENKTTWEGRNLLAEARTHKDTIGWEGDTCVNT